MATTDIKPSIWTEEIDRIITEGSEEELASLRGVPGVRFEAISWEEISQAALAKDVESLSNVGRTPMDLRVYRNFKGKVLSRYATLADYIKELMFHYETQPRKEDGKLVAKDPEGAAAAERVVLWRQSDFPYTLAKDLQHHVVWSTQPLTDEELAKFIKLHRKGWEYVTWVNPAPLASIPAVWHAHVVSRRKSSTRGSGKPPAMMRNLNNAARGTLGKLPGRAGRHFRSASTPN